jgi:hypothetical protein
MLLATVTNVYGNCVEVVAESHARHGQKDRIIEALGALGGNLPNVDEQSLSRYYKYLSARLSFPFTAHYPKPTTALEEVQYRCSVLELLDPAKDIFDDFDGIYCRTRKGKYEFNLPLIELEVRDDSPNLQFIDDYWYWFWNWR